MHGRSDTQSATVPAFLTKLWTLVEDPSTDELICWSANGTAFFVLDQARFAREILPMYFKHSNIASFIRQLNMYGFRKVTGIESGGLKAEKDEVEFAHPYFLRDREQLLEKIKRKVTNQGKGDADTPVPVGKVLEDVQGMQDKQSAMNNKLHSIKRENEALWREVASLRQKHNHQSQIVNKLIQFLVALVGPSRTKLGTAKRKMPLMLTNDASKSPKLPKMQRQLSLDFDNSIGGASITEVESPIFERALDDASLLVSNEGSTVTINDITEADLTETGLQTPLMTLPDTVPIIQSPGDAHTVVVDADGSVEIVPQSKVLSSGPLEPVAVVQSSYEPQVTNFVDDFFQMDDPTNESEPLDDKPTYTESSLPFTSNVSPSSSSSVVSLNQPKIPLQRLSSYNELNSHVESVDTSLEELKDLLSGGQYTVDANTLLGLFNTDVPQPVSTEGLIDLLDDTPKPPEEETVSEFPSSSIVGNEVIQYNPLDLNSLFDLGDLGATPADDLLGNMDTSAAALHDDLHTPTIEETSMFTSPIADKASKGPKAKRKGLPKKVAL